MRLIIRIFSYLILCLLISCRISLPPQSQTRYLKMIPSMQRAVKASLQQKDLFEQSDWPDKNWWEAYGSPELNALMREALCTNPSLQEVRSRIRVAKEKAIVVGSVLYPLIFFDARETRQYLSKNGLYRAFNQKLPLNANVIDLSLSFTYNFDFWGQNRNLLCAALGEEKAQEAEAADAALIVTTSLTQAYFAYKTNLVRKQLFEELIRVRKNIVELQKLLLRKGLASDLQVFLASENLLEAKNLNSNIDDELDSNRHLINILAGRGPDSPLPITPTLPTLPKKLQIPKTLSIDLIARRPDLMAQIWRAKALAYKTGAAMAEYYPDVNLIGFLGLESISWKKLFQIASGTAGLKPSIHLPIFTAGAIGANINATKAEFDAAIFAYNNLLLQSTQEILDVLSFAKDIYRQKQQQGQAVYYAEQRYSLTRLRQEKGLDSDFDIYYLQEDVIQKKLINTALLYNQYLASIKLTKALGGGYCQATVPLVKRV